MINFYFVLRCEEKNRLGAGTEAFGVNYLIFFREFMGFFLKQMNGVDWFASDRDGMDPARAIFDAEKAIELI